jgi:hypothetical protein
LEVEYWTVAMDGQESCGSCDDTLTVVNGAVESLSPLADRLGLSLQIGVRTVTTWAEAASHEIVASPTVRAVGIEMRPAHAEDSEERSWEWRGTRTASVTPDAVLDLLTRALAARSEQLARYLADGGPSPYLRRWLDVAPRTDPPTQASASCGCA